MSLAVSEDTPHKRDTICRKEEIVDKFSGNMRQYVCNWYWYIVFSIILESKSKRVIQQGKFNMFFKSVYSVAIFYIFR